MFSLSGTFPFNEDEEIEDVRKKLICKFLILFFKKIYFSKFVMQILCFLQIHGKKFQKKVLQYNLSY